MVAFMMTCVLLWLLVGVKASKSATEPLYQLPEARVYEV